MAFFFHFEQTDKSCPDLSNAKSEMAVVRFITDFTKDRGLSECSSLSVRYTLTMPECDPVAT